MMNTYNPYPQYNEARIPEQKPPQYSQMAFALQQPEPYSQNQTSMPSINPMSFMKGNGGGMFGGSAGSAPVMAGGDAGIGGGASGGSGGGAMAGLGPIAAIAAAVAATKGVEARNDDNWMGDVLRTFNAPSGAQIMEDPETAGLGALTGLFPFLNHKMNDDAKKARPEWEQLLGF